MGKRGDGEEEVMRKRRCWGKGGNGKSGHE
jgi:hypothetical protein